jgi:galactose oxidase-like protein
MNNTRTTFGPGLAPLLLVAVVALLLPGGSGWAQAKEAPKAKPVVALKDAPANTWVAISREKTGRRSLPIFLYAGNIKKFIMASGIQARYGVRPRHYDTEEFDLAAATWTNAYPPSAAKDRPVSGPVGEAYSKARASTRVTWRTFMYKDGDSTRVGAGGQWLTTRMEYEWTYVPANGKVYAYLFNRTIRYDPEERSWQDLKAKPRAKCKIWGSLCYDPVNKEILHSGGDGGSADVSTWVYKIESNTWSKLEFGSAEMKALGLKAGELLWQARAVLGACCNRFAVSETATEAKADLTAAAKALGAAALKVQGQVKAAKLKGTEKTAAKVALTRLAAVVSATKQISPKLGGKLTAELLGEVRAVQTLCEQVGDALAVEPPGRARSQTAYDPVRKKIVLFGGDGLDRVLSDTWLYDCATRSWEQRFPEQCPKPRAGHVLGWLPKARKVVLAGGYSRTWLAQEIWTYDVKSNKWQILLHLPLQSEDYGRRHFSDKCPRVTSRGTQVGAVNENDVLVCIGPNVSRRGGRVTREGWGRVTWACKVDPAKADAALTAKHSGKSGTYTFSRIAPGVWEKVAKPDPEKTRQVYKNMPVNQWTALEFPRYAPGARNRWGTAAYDTDRHQFLFWGGGHSTSVENDVSHFSVRGGIWTVGYHPDDPIDVRYATMPNVMGYRNNVTVPMHAYKTYCYDPTAKRMFYLNRAYDPARHTWNPVPFPGLQSSGCLKTFMAPTPKGAVTYSSKGLFRFDAKTRRWNKLPWKGPAFGAIWCDGHCLCYDSKRNCLWLSNHKFILKYDLATGTAEKIAVKKPKALGKFILYREQVYLPDADLILLMRVFRKPDGKLANVAWSPAKNKFYWVDLAFVEKNKTIDLKAKRPKVRFSWSDALRYDPKLKLVLLNNCSARRVWALKFDHKSAKMEEMK